MCYIIWSSVFIAVLRSAADICTDLTTEPCSQWCPFFNRHQCSSECSIAHRQSVAVVCMLYKNRCNQMLHFYGALLCSGANEVVHRYTYAPPRCRTSQYRRILTPLPVSLWNDLSESIFDDMGLAGFESRANAF